MSVWRTIQRAASNAARAGPRRPACCPGGARAGAAGPERSEVQRVHACLPAGRKGRRGDLRTGGVCRSASRPASAGASRREAGRLLQQSRAPGDVGDASGGPPTRRAGPKPPTSVRRRPGSEPGRGWKRSGRGPCRPARKSPSLIGRPGERPACGSPLCCQTAIPCIGEAVRPGRRLDTLPDLLGRTPFIDGREHWARLAALRAEVTAEGPHGLSRSPGRHAPDRTGRVSFGSAHPAASRGGAPAHSALQPAEAVPAVSQPLPTVYEVGNLSLTRTKTLQGNHDKERAGSLA